MRDGPNVCVIYFRFNFSCCKPAFRSSRKLEGEDVLFSSQVALSRSLLKRKEYHFHYRYELHREGRAEIGEVSVAGKDNFSRTLDFKKFGRQPETDLPQIGTKLLCRTICTFIYKHVLC